MNLINCKSYLILFISICFFVINGLSEEVNQKSSATLPLPELLELYQKSKGTEDTVKKSPPLKATINRIILEGHLLENAVDITAHVEIVVMEDEEWITVPFLKLDKSISIAELPDVQNAVITNMDGELSIITQKKGVYTFPLSLFKRAKRNSLNRTATIAFCKATKSELRLRYDDDLFRILDDNLIVEPEGVLIYPVENIFNIKWAQKKSNIKSKKTVVRRPPIESMVKAAYASTVSTLEGKSITRIIYELRFEGTKSISFAIPDKSKLEKVYLNGSAISFKCKDQEVSVEVLPARAGDQSGKVELVLTKLQGNYLLSGTLNFSTPKVSWPVHEMYFDLFLPKVFNYSCRDGSFESTVSSSEVEYTYSIPIPGKRLSFHQYLITSTAPSITIDYAVDLQGKYFSSTGVN